LVLNMSLEATYAGAPIAAAGDRLVVGMVTGPPDAAGRRRLAVHARHIDDLLKTVTAKPRPLRELDRIEAPDAAAHGNPGRDPPPEPIRALPEERLGELESRRAQWSHAAARLDESLSQVRPPAVSELEKQMAPLKQNIANENAHPEEAYKVVVQRTRQQGKRSVSYSETQTRYRLSAAQIARVNEWDRELQPLAGRQFAIVAGGTHEEEFELAP
jgi:hypothetical protein